MSQIHHDVPDHGLFIPRLGSGGIMPNYLCSSRCRHCSYFSGPHWSRDYISEDTARHMLRVLRDMGCRAVHIGGGEPFLGGTRLVELVRWCREEDIAVDYIETNSSWFTNPQAADNKLSRLLEAGAHTLLISMDPFHNEFIPWRKVQGVLDACDRTGMGVFPWTAELGREVRSLDTEVAHTLQEYEDRFGPDYLKSIPGRYWVSPRGRAIELFRQFAPQLTADGAAADGGDGCAELFDVSHFHIDLYGNYVPGVCSGLSIHVNDLGRPLDPDKYRFLTTLMAGGVRQLLEIVQNEYEYVPDRMFSGKCDLCYELRRHLVVRRGVKSPDLQPAELYIHMD